jgi:hypothetical protein
MASAELRIEKLEESFPRRQGHRDPAHLNSQELSFEILEILAETPPEDEFWARVREDAAKRHATRHRGLRDYICDDDPRLSAPLDFYVSDLMRELLGRFHDKVKDPALLIERYRGRFPDRTLAATYYAAYHHAGSTYSETVRAKLGQLAKLQSDSPES